MSQVIADQQTTLARLREQNGGSHQSPTIVKGRPPSPLARNGRAWYEPAPSKSETATERVVAEERQDDAKRKDPVDHKDDTDQKDGSEDQKGGSEDQKGGSEDQKDSSEGQGGAKPSGPATGRDKKSKAGSSSRRRAANGSDSTYQSWY